VERHEGYEAREVVSYKFKLMNNLQARILLRLIPNFGEDFPHFNLSYLSKVLGINSAYLLENLDFLTDKELVTFDGENYFITRDNLWKVESILNSQAMILLARKISDFEK
jgi:hypothetical protein